MSVPAIQGRGIREYSIINKTVDRPGCPTTLIPTYKIYSEVKESRAQLIQEFAAMCLVHLKNDLITNYLFLDKIHHQLELDSLALHKSGSSNILLSQVSFDILIENRSKEKTSHYITFPLKIPGTNIAKEGVFSYEMVEKMYEKKANLYAALKHFYGKGQTIANNNHEKHGHEPDYDPKSSSHDQYIRHTEQLLVAYLALPEAATMLVNRLRSQIRAQNPDAIAVKIYNMVLHMHSTKTCCAPCEYSLLGLMNERQGPMLNGKRLGFLPNFESACRVSNEGIMLTLPTKIPFKLLVTVTASTSDAHHQKQPLYTKKSGTVPFFQIAVRSPTVSHHIYTAMMNTKYDARRVPLNSNLNHLTVGISGSKSTSGSPKTMKKINEVRENEMRSLSEILGTLNFEEKKENP